MLEEASMKLTITESHAELLCSLMNGKCCAEEGGGVPERHREEQAGGAAAVPCEFTHLSNQKSVSTWMPHGG
jgi:hypothetical protein